MPPGFVKGSEPMNINANIWHDERLRKLSKEGVIAFMYLLTSPHSNMAGFYVLPLEYMAYDLNWTPKVCDEILSELESHWLIKRDAHKKVVLVMDHLKNNPVGGANQLKGIVNLLKKMPSTYLMKEFYELIKEFLTEQTKVYLENIKSLTPDFNRAETVTEPLRNPSETVSKGLAKGCGTVTEPLPKGSKSQIKRGKIQKKGRE